MEPDAVPDAVRWRICGTTQIKLAENGRSNARTLAEVMGCILWRVPVLVLGQAGKTIKNGKPHWIVAKKCKAPAFRTQGQKLKILPGSLHARFRKKALASDSSAGTINSESCPGNQKHARVVSNPYGYIVSTPMFPAGLAPLYRHRNI